MSTTLVVANDERWGLRLTHNFWLNEFQCRCWDIYKPQPAEGFCMGAVRPDAILELVVPLQRLRDKWGPLIVESGHRCWLHHERIYEQLKKEPTLRSAHLYSLGADVYPVDGAIERTDENRAMLQDMGFKGVGWGLGSQHNKIHLDVMARKGKDFAEWSYV